VLGLLDCCLFYRYWSLLGKHHHDNRDLSPLPYVMKLLLNRDCSESVSAYIMEMVDNLLNEPDQQEETGVIEVLDSVCPPADLTSKSDGEMFSTGITL